MTSTESRMMLLDDYSEGAHPAVLDALVAANPGQHTGYGRDAHCALAAERIHRHLGREADVHLVVGGTQANIICLAAMLRPHEGVIAAASAHIAVHETGAIEATGHKILTVPSPDGKLTPDLVDQAMATHDGEHTVLPRAVFISHATEAGTTYAVAELETLVGHAHHLGLMVHLDGARLAMAIAAEPRGGLSRLAGLGIDTLYLGGTKNGALCGEAIVVLNPALRADFRYHIKQRGALLAKGRLLGAQFARLFDDDLLWLKLGAHANAAAQRLSAGLTGLGVELARPPAVNQVFAVLPCPVIETLRPRLGFHVWEPRGPGHALIRLVCSWATEDTAVDRAIGHVREALEGFRAAGSG